MARRSNPSYRKFRRAAYLLVAAVALYTAFCHIMNALIIPRIIIPKMRVYLESGISEPLKISVGDIRFEPVGGFLFKDVRLYTKQGSPADYIVSSKAVDIDLVWHELLFKHIAIRRFDMTDADLRISRGIDGSWNVSPLAHVGLGKASAKDFGGFSIIIKELRLLGGKIRYSDRMMPENSTERAFEIANMSIIGSDDGSCRLAFSARSTGTKKDSLSLFLTYFGKDPPRGEGNIRIRTANINEFWGYYLDDAMKPWKLGAADIDLKADISFTEDMFRLDGIYNLKKAELDYGDLRISADAAIKHELEYAKGGKAASSAGLLLKGMEICAGNNVMLSGAECRAYIDGKGVGISALEGQVLKKPVSYKGMFVFGEPKRLSLDGQVCGIRNTLDMEILGNDKANSELQVFTSYSKLTVKAESKDLKDLAFDIRIDGDIDLSGMGKASVSGALSGELDRAESLNGKAEINMNGFTFLEMTPKSFSLKATVKDGLLDGEIPKFPLYGGTAAARVRLDAGLSPLRWGFELDLEKCDLKSLAGDDDRLSGIKGIFDANFACSGIWGRPETATGGGHIEVLDCSLKGAPLFVDIEKGVGSVVKDFSMPDFKEIKAAFGVAEKEIEMRSYCDSPLLKMEMSGNCDFSGNVEMTAGANVSRLDPLKTARQILLPVTLGFDFVKDGILIKVTGKWPELKQQTVIKPMRVFDEVFGFMKSIDMRRYSLDETWAQMVESSQ